MVYVDDAYRPYKGTRYCHRLADTPAELRAFATRLGLRMAWLQQGGTHREHFDDAEDLTILEAWKTGQEGEEGRT